jgi:hypothetical protein
MASSAEAGRVSPGKGTNAYQGMPALLEKTKRHAATWFASLAERAARATVSPNKLRGMLGGPLPQRGVDADSVVEALSNAGMRGTVATAGPGRNRGESLT